MPTEPLLHTWIVEALGATGRTASPLTVAKLVWAHHEQDLRARGDLLFTWQLDLRDVATEMEADGRLLVDDAGDWRLPDDVVVPRPKPRTWGEDEIALAVGAYVDLLRAEHSGRPARRDEAVADVATRTARSIEQVEAMFANISHVVGERDISPLTGIHPRSNVPRGVRQAVAAALA